MTEDKKQEFKLRITRANPTELTVILYEMALAYVEDAENVDIHPGEGTDYLGTRKEFRDALDKANGCIEELSSSLNSDYELSGTLLSLYVYAEKEIAQAGVDCDKKHLEIVKKILSDLRNSFAQIQDQDSRPARMENAQNVYAGYTYGKSEVNETVTDPAGRGYLA